MSAQQLGRLLQAFGQQIVESGSISVEDVTVTLPDEVHAIVRHEEAPHGLVLKFEAHWTEGSETGPLTKTISDLLDPDERGW